MICLQQEHIQSGEMLHDIVVIISQVCSDPHGFLSLVHPVAYRLCRIMGNGKGLHGQISQPEILILPDFMEDILRKFSQTFGSAYGFNGSPGGVNGNLILSGNDSQPPDMIRVLMGDQNSGKIPCGKIQVIEPEFHPFSADSRVHQHVGAVASHIDTVSAAAARYTT